MPVIDGWALTRLEQEIAQQEQILYRPSGLHGFAVCPLCGGVIDWSRGAAGALRMKRGTVQLICHTCTADLALARELAYADKEGR